MPLKFQRVNEHFRLQKNKAVSSAQQKNEHEWGLSLPLQWNNADMHETNKHDTCKTTMWNRKKTHTKCAKQSKTKKYIYIYAVYLHLAETYAWNGLKVPSFVQWPHWVCVNEWIWTPVQARIGFKPYTIKIQ